MAKENFIWIGEQTCTRSRAGRGAAVLEKGKAYPAAEFDLAVIEEWIRTGHAKWAAKEKNPAAGSGLGA